MEDNKGVPSLEEQTKQIEERIKFLEPRLRLQELNTKLAQLRADELEAYAKTAHFSKPQSNIVEHTLTEKDIKENPELTKQGFKVGDKVGVPQPTQEG